MDLLDQITRTRRQVTDRGATKVVALTRTYDTTVEDLWDACTNPDRLRRWFEPVSGDLHEGGRYRLDGSGSAGTIERCEAPTLLRLSWEYEGDVSYLEVSLREVADGAAVEVRHEVSDDDHWATYGPGATGVGWDSGFLALALYLADDTRAEPAWMEAFGATQEGREFVRRTADAWARVDVDAGTAPDRARTVADATTAAYTGADASS